MRNKIAMGVVALVVVAAIIAIIFVVVRTKPANSEPPQSAPTAAPTPPAASPSPTPPAKPTWLKARSLDRPKILDDNGAPFQTLVEFDSGIWVVNQEIAPGKYKSRVPPKEDPYWFDNKTGRCVFLFERNGAVVEWGTAQPGERLSFYIDPTYTIAVFHDCGHLEKQ